MAFSRNLIVHCQFMAEDSELCFIPINIRANNQCNVMPIPCDANNFSQVDQFFRRFNTLIYPGGIKALVFITTDNEFESFEKAYYFRQKFRDYCKFHGIYCSFPTQDSMHMFGALITTKILVAEGEEVVFIRSRQNQSTRRFSDAEAMVAIKEKNGYRFLRNLDRMEYSLTPAWKTKFLRGTNPKRVIILQTPGDLNNFANGMKRLFKDENVALKPFLTSLDMVNEPILAKVMHEMGERASPFYISPMCLNTFFVKYDGNVLISVTLDKVMPFEESGEIDVDPSKSVTLSTDFPFPGFIEKIKLDKFKCKKAKITFKVDVNSFYDFKVNPIEDEKLEEELSSLNIPETSSNETTAPLKARITFDKQNFSVCVIENVKEKLLEDSDGMNKTPIYIAFTQAKPLIGKSAKEMFNEKPEFVVFDLIKLCSIASTDVMSPKWKFNLSKDDDDDKIMVEMQTLEGEKQSNVEFLLALIIRNAIERIKKETGERMSELEIGFNGFEANEMLKKNFVEAGKLKNCKIAFI